MHPLDKMQGEEEATSELIGKEGNDMKRMSSAFAAIVVALTAITIGACTQSEDSATNETTTTESVVTTTTQPPTTTAPATTTIVQETTTTEAVPAVEVPGPGEPWDLLFIRNSIYLSEKVPELYAQLAEDALGIEIRLLDAGGLDPRYAWQVLAQLQNESHPPLGDAARQAEIIVVYGDPEDSGPNHSETVIDDEFENCFYGAQADPQPPVLSTVEEWQPYRDYLDAIYAEIWALREGTPTVLLATDVHNPGLSNWQRDRNLDSACTAYWASWSELVREAAEHNGATMVSVFELLNGPDGSLDPLELGYTGGSKTHWATTNEVGSEMVADALAAAGFEPTTQP